MPKVAPDIVTCLPLDQNAAETHRILRDLAPLAGRVDCAQCDGLGAYTERTSWDGVAFMNGEPLGTADSIEITLRCTCVELSNG